MRLSIPGLDPFILLLLGTVGLAAFLPAGGKGFEVVDQISILAIGTLFFLHGLRLSREAVVNGLSHWRLHLTILAITFALFPLVVLSARWLLPDLVTPPLWVGLLFLAALPSTVQSSIAFTSIAGGNVAGAVVSAAASNMIGVALTPALMAMMVAATGASLSFGGIGKVVLLLLLPFVLGQVMRRWLAGWAARTRRLTSFFDRGTIILAVYVAFSEATNEGVWRLLPLSTLLDLILLASALLLLVLLLSYGLGRVLGFSREDRIAILFCGSKKSLATGVPMAKLLFAGSAVGPIVVPLMIFHQVQLMACAWLARRWGRASTVALHADAGHPN